MPLTQHLTREISTSDTQHNTLDTAIAALRGLAKVLDPEPINTPLEREQIAVLIALICERLETGLQQMLQALESRA